MTWFEEFMDGVVRNGQMEERKWRDDMDRKVTDLGEKFCTLMRNGDGVLDYGLFDSVAVRVDGMYPESIQNYGKKQGIVDGVSYLFHVRMSEFPCRFWGIRLQMDIFCESESLGNDWLHTNLLLFMRDRDLSNEIREFGKRFFYEVK